MRATYKPLLLSCMAFAALAVVFLLSLAVLSSAHADPNIGAAIALLPWAAAAGCAAFLGYAARNRVWLQLSLFGSCAAVGFGLVNLAHEVFIGPVDFAGLAGARFVVGMALPFLVILCLAAGALGVGLRRVTQA